MGALLEGALQRARYGAVLAAFARRVIGGMAGLKQHSRSERSDGLTAARLQALWIAAALRASQ
jgi:hypothetical protein